MQGITISIGISARNRFERTVREKGKSLIDFPDEYTVIDTETTGLDSRYDSLIEVGAIRCKNGIEVDRFSELIKPESCYILDKDDIKKTDDYCIHDGEYIQYVDSFITELTGITNKMLENARDQKSVLADFLEFLGNQIVIGHNVNFDINFLYDAIWEDFGKKLSNDYVDTMRIARKLLKDKLSHHRLRDVAGYYGIDYSHAHRAIDDCQITHGCLRHMQKDIINVYITVEDFISAFKINRQSLKAKDIIPLTNEFNEDHPLYGMVCVFTGALERMTRREVVQIVANIGGINGDNVTAQTNYLILGNLDYCRNIKDGKSNKLKKAERLKLKGQDIEIVSENVFYDMLEMD